MGQFIVSPSRRVLFGTPVIDQFPVFLSSDGFTKVSGLNPSTQMVTQVFQNGVLVVQAVTITEIGVTGDYKLTFTPGSIGEWVVDIRIVSQSQSFRATYDVQLDGVVAGQKFYEVIRDIHGNGLPYVLVEIFTSGTATLLTSTNTTYDGSYSLPLTGNLSSNPLVDIRYSGAGIQALTKTAVRLA